MQGQPRVSIILPVYNMETCLETTLDSLLNQTYSDFELICIDDGSTDGSAAILRDRAASDDRIEVISQANAGQGEARNRGLEMARGEYLMLLDADDVYDGRFVQALVERADVTGADIVVCRCSELEDDTGRIRKSLWTVKAEQLPTHDPFSPNDMADCIFTAFVGWPWDKIYRRSFIEELDLRFPSLANSEDLYFVFLALAKAKSISFLDEDLILHRIGRSGSVSNSRMTEPFAFYDGICLLKEELQRDHELYARFEWGLLNWAFDYTIWNIESMTQVATRRAMIERLMDGGLPELEIDKHPKAYYSLEPSDAYRFEMLREELGQTLHDAEDREHRAWLRYPIAFLTEWRFNGFGGAFGKVAARFGRTSRKRNDDEVERGSAYFEQDDSGATKSESENAR